MIDGASYLVFRMLLRTRRTPSGFSNLAFHSPPSVPGWIHEVKHDGIG
jgi:hypothetical protein